MAEQTKTGGPAFPRQPGGDTGMTLRRMGKVDPNEAPEGYVAVESEGCHGCAFNAVELTACQEKTPCGVHRKDGCNVIFVKKPDDGKATASRPYDSEGTPVEVNHA